MIFNMVGGGAGGAGGGATLVVSSPANVSVTVSKDDKSYTKNSGSLGSATFKGLATGTWTVAISGNGQTATRTIEITADYAITIAFFSATINITYPANSNCVVTNSGGQTVASDTNSTSSEKTFTATVNATGTYTVTATATDGSGNTKSESVEITSEGQSVSVALLYRTYLYNKGDECTTITGGWVKRKGQLTKNTDNLYVRGNGSECGIGQTTNKIDLSSYTKLYAIVTTTGSNNFSLGLTTTTSHATGGPNSVTASVAPSAGVTKTQYSVDVSAINDANNYAYIYSHAYESDVGIYLYEMWLE